MYKYKVIATIVEIRGEGKCSYGHKVGDSFEFGKFTPEDCVSLPTILCVRQWRRYSTEAVFLG